MKFFTIGMVLVKPRKYLVNMQSVYLEKMQTATGVYLRGRRYENHITTIYT